MKANPKTFYEPADMELFGENVAEILTGATTYHQLAPHQQQELKLAFTPIALEYFEELDIAPTLDNILQHQTEIRKDISEEVRLIHSEMDLMDAEESFLGLGKKAKARRQARKAAKATTTSTNTKGTSNWRNAWDQNGNWLGESVPMDTDLEDQLAQVEGKSNGSNWQQTLQAILGTTNTVVGAIQGNKQQAATNTTQTQFFPNLNQEPPKEKKVLGMQPVVGIAVISIMVLFIFFALWQVMQNKSK